MMTNAKTIQQQEPKLTKTLANTALVHLEINVWAGQAKLNPADIRLGDGGKLPPSELAQIGHKKICDPTLLTVFKSLRERIRNYVKDFGVPLMGGYAVPVDAIPKITPALDKFIEEFNQAKNKFEACYDASLDEWIQEHPEFANAIRSSVLSVEDAVKRINASYSVYQLAPVEGAEERLEGTDTSMCDELIDEVQKEAKKFYDKHCGSSISKVDPRTVATWKNLRFKVSGLTFLDAKFDALHDLLVETIDLYKANAGSVTGINLEKLKHNALVLSTSEINRYLAGAPTSLDAEPAAADSIQEAEEASSGSGNPEGVVDAEQDVSDAEATAEEASTSRSDAEAPKEQVLVAEDKSAQSDDFDALFGDLDDFLSEPDAEPTGATESTAKASDAQQSEPNERVVSSLDWGAW